VCSSDLAVPAAAVRPRAPACDPRALVRAHRPVIQLRLHRRNVGARRDELLQEPLDLVEGFLQELVSTRTNVPPVKPKLYYRAVRAHQRARIVGWRARSNGRGWNGVRIFGYHRVSEDDDVFAVTPAAFRAQMRLLHASDVEVVSLRDALDLLDGTVDGQFACITFDDGYLDNLEHAVPVLDELGLPATIYVISDVLEGRASYDWYATPPPHLTVADLPQVTKSGLVDVQAHSRTHRRLTLLDDNDLHREVTGCKERLEQYVPALTSFSYPAGLYGDREVRAVLDAGFRAGVSTAPGVNAGGQPLGELRRTMIYWGDDANAFDAKLRGALDAPSRLGDGLRARRARPRRAADLKLS